MTGREERSLPENCINVTLAQKAVRLSKLGHLYIVYVLQL